MAAMRELLAGLVPGLPEARREGDRGARRWRSPLRGRDGPHARGGGPAAPGRRRTTSPRGDLTALAVPETLTALIGARLDGLKPEDRALVQQAAVLGQTFTLAGLSAVIADSRGGHSGAAARDLVRRELLSSGTPTPARRSAASSRSSRRSSGRSRTARWHEEERKARHLAAARFFEALGSDELAGALAGQYLAAYRNAPPGPEADALAGQARLALRGAADRASELGAHDQAVSLLDQATQRSLTTRRSGPRSNWPPRRTRKRPPCGTVRARPTRRSRPGRGPPGRGQRWRPLVRGAAASWCIGRQVEPAIEELTAGHQGVDRPWPADR